MEKQKFAIKNLGKSGHYLGLPIERTNEIWESLNGRFVDTVDNLNDELAIAASVSIAKTFEEAIYIAVCCGFELGFDSILTSRQDH